MCISLSLSLSMYIYIYIYIYTCVYIYIYIYIPRYVTWGHMGVRQKQPRPLRQEQGDHLISTPMHARFTPDAYPTQTLTHTPMQ